MYLRNGFHCTELPYRFNFKEVEIIIAVVNQSIPNLHIDIYRSETKIILGDNTIYTYGAHHSTLTSTTARLVTVLRAPPRNATVWPGGFLEITLPDDTPTDAEYALEPRTDAPSARRVKPSAVWPPPGIVTSIAGRIRIPNLTSEPRSLKRNEHFCQVRQLFEPSNVTTTSPARAFPSTDTLHSANVSLDPDSLLPSDIKAKFKALHHEYDQVFDANIEGYNGHVGPFEARVHMGPVEPPQRKGRLPQYAREKLLELQDKFDELENQGVFKRPEDVGISVEYLNPSFLVRKPNGGSRLVTAFADVGRYSKPQPSLMPNVDSTLRQIAQWNHLIATDLTSAFYQIPLSRDSLKYCGVATPFRGVRVYTRCAMDVEVLAGTPFMEKNDIAVRPAKGQIILGDNTIYTYGAHHSTLTSTTARLVTVLRAPPRNATVWPGGFLEITLPDDTPTDAEYALEPRTDAPSARRVKPSAVWPPPGIVTSIAGRIRIPNLTSEPRSLKRNEHFCQVRQLFEPSNVTTTSPARAFPSTDTLHSANVSLDPDSLLPSDIKAKFKALHHEYDQVFDANIEGYNGHVGPFEARVHMGPVEPPQRKGRLPQYAREKLLELQDKFDELENQGVFKRPEDLYIFSYVTRQLTNSRWPPSAICSPLILRRPSFACLKLATIALLSVQAAKHV
ncbi:predicted protein [Nematostella vectensis]|uniref:Reverse transcriptase domain-containing protein n=1 Tax=Nematostella vectensis TaxID=45351 RepID=A7S444_NEMVE|nr:predicted protein [Nematostella vectensis]|eukprot:XP_001633599.1 predicted protein [Nematostella vectensis]